MSSNTMKEHFQLSNEITFFNHGSFGACPTPIFENYQYWQRELEKEPVQFFIKKGPEALKASKKVFAEVFQCHTDDFFFCPNPSTAFNTVIKSLDLQEGDEILSTNLEYGAMDRTWKFYCKKSGAKYIQQNIPLPIESKEAFLEAFWNGVSSKTKYVFLSQITSSTALILPIKEICDKARELGIISIIDGAHVPGHIPLNINELNPDYYTGALHKWYLAPKGLSFLYVSKIYQALIDPLIVSWGYESDFPSHSQFLDYNEFNGTRDFSAYLCMPAMQQFWQETKYEQACKAAKNILHTWYPKFCELLNTKPICPVNEAFLGQMCAIPIQTQDAFKLKDILYSQYKIEIPITNLGKQYFIRISMQAYNTEEELNYLYDVLAKLYLEKIYLR